MRVRNGLQVCDEWVYAVHDEHNEMGARGGCRVLSWALPLPEILFTFLVSDMTKHGRVKSLVGRGRKGSLWNILNPVFLPLPN